jgi:hypothetical protein
MSQSTGTKRTRTDQPDNTQIHTQATGHNELLIACPELQTQLGQKFCDEAGLLPLLLAHGIVRRVRTISVTVQTLGGDRLKVKLNATAPSVGEAKSEIARTQGTVEARQELYKVAVRADGCAVREDDAEPESLDDDAAELEDGQMVAMAVKELPLVWRTCDEEVVVLSEGGAVATKPTKYDEYGEYDEDADLDQDYTLATSGVELTAGKHYWEVDILDRYFYVGVTRPNLNPKGDCAISRCTDAWFFHTYNGGLYGNGEDGSVDGHDIGGTDPMYDICGRVGVLLDLDEGSLRFFVNGVLRCPHYPAGSVTGPVVCAVLLYASGGSARLLPQDTDHALQQQQQQ